MPGARQAHGHRPSRRPEDPSPGIPIRHRPSPFLFPFLSVSLLAALALATPSGRAATTLPAEPAVGTAAGSVGAPSATPSPTLTRIRQIRELSPNRAAERLPVEVEGVVTLVDPARSMRFIQDDSGGIYLQLSADGNYQAGQRLRVTGHTEVGRFTPYLQATSIQVIGTAPLPAAPAAGMVAFRAGFLEGERMALEGRVIGITPAGDRTRIKLVESGSVAVAWVPRPDGTSADHFLHARVRIRGVCAGVFNDADEITDFHLHAAHTSDVEILDPPPPTSTEPASTTIPALDLGWREGGDDRIRCQGRVTLHWPGRYLFIMDGSRSLELRTDSTETFHPGDEVEAIGLRAVAHRRMVLTECSVRKIGHLPPPEPMPTRLDHIRSRHSHGDLVELDAQLIEIIDPNPETDPEPGTEPAPARTTLVLRMGQSRIRAELPPDVGVRDDALPGVRSLIRIPGVLAARPDLPGEPMTYHLLVTSPDAIRVLRGASWWTLGRATTVLGGTGFILISALGWGFGLSERRRRKAEQTIQRHHAKAIRHRDALLELAQLVQTVPEEDAVRRITERVAQTLGATRVGVWRIDDAGPDLECVDLFTGLGHESGERILASEHKAYFAAVDACRIIAADDARTDPRTREFTEDYLRPKDIHSMLDVPVRFHGRAAGVLCIEHTGGPRVWDVEEQDFAAGVGDQLALLREASERQRAEQALREAHSELEIRVMLRTTQLAEARDRAEAADRLKSAFLATMSHELRTPLNSIIGFTGILSQGLVGPLNPEQKKQLGMVQNSSRHLLSLINDVLDISRIEAGQVEIARAPFSPQEVIARVAELLLPLATRKGVTLTTTVDPDIGTLTSDRRRVEQILINLANNAVKFTEKGSVHIEARPVDDTLEFHVHDTGIGIPGDQVSKLFKPFQQLDSGLARQHEGTGLGLAICSGLVKLLGGSIRVRSEPGRGSTFSVTLPRESRPKPEPKPKPE